MKKKVFDAVLFVVLGILLLLPIFMMVLDVIGVYPAVIGFLSAFVLFQANSYRIINSDNNRVDVSPAHARRYRDLLSRLQRKALSPEFRAAVYLLAGIEELSDYVYQRVSPNGIQFDGLQNTCHWSLVTVAEIIVEESGAEDMAIGELLCLPDKDFNLFITALRVAQGQVDIKVKGFSKNKLCLVPASSERQGSER